MNGSNFREVRRVPMNLPPQVGKRVEEWEERQRHNPVEWEKVEHNLDFTKVRRTIPITSHYFSNNNEREQPSRG